MNKMHKSITVDKVCNLVESNQKKCENIGLCIACGEKQGSCEPDAQQYECESCGEKAVYGAEELLMHL